MSRESQLVHGRIEAAPEGVGSTNRSLTTSLRTSKEVATVNGTRIASPTTRKTAADPHPSLVEAVAVTRFWNNVELSEDTECWPWRGSLTKDGYGEFFFHGKMHPAHALALSFTTGEIRASGLDTCHSCDNPPCCNPLHLRFGTRQSNVDEMHDRNRAPIGESHASSKLTNHVVREIRERRASGARQIDLARQYGISSAYVSDIVNGFVWHEAGGTITGRSKRTKRYPTSRRGKLSNGK